MAEIVVPIVIAPIIIVGLIVAGGTFFIVEQTQVAMVERFGRFVRIARAGLNIKLPLIERRAGRLSMRVQQLNVKVETKTRDTLRAIGAQSRASTVFLPHSPGGASDLSRQIAEAIMVGNQAPAAIARKAHPAVAASVPAVPPRAA